MAKEEKAMNKVFRIKRIIAGVMTCLVAFTFSMSGVRVDAAEKKGVTYIKDFKLYIDKDKDPNAAKDWFEKNDYTMIEGNLNEDASGALKSEVGVYLGYSTTTEREEAVTDLAVMNERGNYSVAEYKRMLEEQKKVYADMVSDMKTMLEEYRINVDNNVPTAVRAKRFMNNYKEDDSGQRLGDLLMTISDDALKTLLMQANGQIVLMIQEQLAAACDTGKTTWLDRLAKLGSYQKLRKQALRACNNDVNKANRTLDKMHKESATILLDNWEDIRQHITDIREKIKDWGLEKKDAAEIDRFFDENADNSEIKTFVDKYNFINTLGLYTYEDKTLVEFFDQPAEEFRGDGIRKLYPLAAALSEGQVSAVDQSVSLFTLLLDALNSGAVNEYQSCEITKAIEEASDEDKENLDMIETAIDDYFDDLEDDELTSVYEGVDREIFKDGVAVTSTALSFSNGDGLTWADAFVNSGLCKKISIGVGAASLLSLVGGRVSAYITSKISNNLGKRLFDHNVEKVMKVYNKKVTELSKNAANYEVALENIKMKYEYYKIYVTEGGKPRYNGLNYNAFKTYEEQDRMTRSFFKKSALAGNEKAYKTATFFEWMEVGLNCASLLLAVADLVMTSIALGKYYNREHLPIPGYMVDMSYDEENETTLIDYKSVPDQDGGHGDVNGGGGKQWLALYQTHDEDAGVPLLAPENGEEFGIIVQYGSSEEPKIEGYTPLHLFGTANSPQNLTFSDGESGWSFNDGKKGTYVFFRRESDKTVEDEKVEEEKEEKEEAVAPATDAPSTETPSGEAPAVSGSAADAGAALGGGTVALTGVLCGACGVILGIAFTALKRKKKIADR